MAHHLPGVIRKPWLRWFLVSCIVANVGRAQGRAGLGGAWQGRDNILILNRENCSLHHNGNRLLPKILTRQTAKLHLQFASYNYHDTDPETKPVLQQPAILPTWWPPRPWHTLDTTSWLRPWLSQHDIQDCSDLCLICNILSLDLWMQENAPGCHRGGGRHWSPRDLHPHAALQCPSSWNRHAVWSGT